MAEIPTLKESQPILEPVQINSDAEGHEAFAKVLGSIASQAESKTEELVQEQSNAQLMQSASQMETAKVNSEIELLKNPGQASKIAEASATLLNDITQNSFVNDRDRKKLQTIASDTFNELRLKSAHIGYEEAKRGVAISFWDNYPVINSNIEDALIKGDLKKAEMLEKTLHQSAFDAAKIGAITPEQFGNIKKTNYELYKKIEYLHHMAENSELYNAQHFHAATQSPFSLGSYDNVNHPINANTHYVASDYNFDRSMGGQYTALYNDQQLNYGVIALSQPHEYDQFIQQMSGVNQVKGAVQSGMPFSQIDNRIKSLEAQPKLSQTEEGEVKYWKSFTNRLNSGDGYLNLMTQTTLGGRYVQEHAQVASAIQSSGKTPEETFKALRDNDNAYIGHMISLGQAQHIDPHFIRPIPGGWTSEVQSSFAKNAPVDKALARISYVDSQYRPYLADAMTKPNQAMAVYLAGSTMDKVDPTFLAQLIESNQDRDYSSLLKTGKDESKDSNVWDDMNSDPKMKSILTYISKLPGGTDSLNGFKQTAINYVLYRAAKEEDIHLNGKATYEQDFISNITKGFDVVEGNRYVFNNSTLNLRKVDMDFIADFAISEAYRHLHEGRTEEEFQAYVDINPLHAINSPDNRIVVIDKYGHAAVDVNGRPVFDHPYTNDMLSHAQKQSTEISKEMAKYFGFTENLQHEARLHPGFPFVVKPEEAKLAEIKTKQAMKGAFLGGGNE